MSAVTRSARRPTEGARVRGPLALGVADQPPVTPGSAGRHRGQLPRSLSGGLRFVRGRVVDPVDAVAAQVGVPSDAVSHDPDGDPALGVETFADGAGAAEVVGAFPTDHPSSMANRRS